MWTRTRPRQLPPVIQLIMAAALLCGTAVAAPAQIFMGGPLIRPFGYSGPVNAFGYYAPLSIIGPGGVANGYVGPNGVYVPPGGANYYAPYGPYGPYPPYGGAVEQGVGGTLGPGLAPESGTQSAAPETGSATVSPDGRSVTIRANGNLYGSPEIPRTSDSIDARIDSDNQLVIRWSGEPRAVSRVVFSLLDKDHRVLKQQTVAKLPVQARLALTSRTAYYQVQVEYVNGTTTSVVSPL